MSAQFARFSHTSRSAASAAHEPHAALLIDFDNVTMGIRSDITKELKNLLNSDIIKGKVAVQRAYADWRRYPQYVVPLAEASIDLIFAPAYGSSKKNATDIRLAIDALELVFTRPEIGTFILLSGDSDFSSLVLKLKEYGKYIVGVGIRESASDLLVQNCDEYYSYSALTGLTRAGDEEHAVSLDPWELVDIAVRQMVAAGDVMRSDRLKQVLLELDPNFDEKQLGFSKFNRFVAEAANRGLLHLQKMENGQFEIALTDGVEAPPQPLKPERSRGRGRRREERDERPPEKKPEVRAAIPAVPAEPVARNGDMGLAGAYDLLRRAARELGGTPDRAVRDSDVKRRMLDLDPEFDEGTFGFSKFSRFLRQAHDAELINLRKIDNGNYELTLPDGVTGKVAEDVEAAQAPTAREHVSAEDREERGRGRRGRRGGRREDRPREPDRARMTAETAEQREPPAPSNEPVPARPAEDSRAATAQPAQRPQHELPLVAAEKKDAAPITKPAADARTGAGSVIGLRRGSRGARPGGPPPLLEGQAVGKAKAPAESLHQEQPPAPGFSAADLGLPVKREAVVDYLTKAYKGIGRKSAESLIDSVGADRVFTTLADSPDRVREVLGVKRGDTLLDAWTEDYARRTGGRRTAPAGPASSRTNAAPATAPAIPADATGDAAPPPETVRKKRPRGRRGGRKRNTKAGAESGNG
jgi:uncharacterized protein (TIGR00288 family)